MTPSRRTRPVPHAWLVWIALLVLYFVWGSTYLAIRLVVESMPPLLAASMRFLAAGGIVMAWLAIRRGPASLRITRRQALASAIVGGALLLGGNGLVSIGERDVPSGLAALIIAAVPLWVVILRRVAGERPARVAIFGVVVGMAGVALLILPRGIDGTVAVGGMLALLVSSISWSTGSFVSRRLDLPSDPLSSTAYQLVAGGLLLGVAGVALGEVAAFDPARFEFDSIVSLVYLVFFGSVLAYTAYTWLLQNAPISKVATYAYVNPVVAVALGVVFLQEEFGASMFLGAAMIVTAVAVIVTAEARSADGDTTSGALPEPAADGRRARAANERT